MNKFMNDTGLFFVPMGGSEEFGCNLNLYVCDGRYLLIDCGIGFADERHPGIDILLPDPKFIAEQADKIDGLVITHAHEDHIGAVAHLWPRLKCPIYTAPFTAAILKRKLSEQGLRHVDIRLIDQHNPAEIGDFGVSFLPVSHSVPDSHSVLLETPHGNVLHSGDWNLDPAPVIGAETDAAAFMALADKNILAYVGDSTNAEVDGYSGSESDVAAGMIAEFKRHRGKIAVTLFASNIGRIISIARAAEASGRSVAVIGRSLHRMIAAATECGYMKDVPPFVNEHDIANIPDENLVVLLTGSQGESRAALARVARGDHSAIRLNKRDTVIFSARPIPGNERTINAVKNALSGIGATIVTPRDTDNTIHVSGHPCAAEITKMLQWVRPHCVIPVHGERMQLDAHARLADSLQIAQTCVPHNGAVIKIAKDGIAIVDDVETGMLAVDQRRIIPATHQSITARRKLQYSGTVFASLVLDENLNCIGKIKVDTVGLTCIRNDDCIIEDIRTHLDSRLDDLADEGVEDEDEIAEELRISLRKFVMQQLGIRPKTSVHVAVLES